MGESVNKSELIELTRQHISDHVRLRAETAEDGALLQEAFPSWALELLEEKGEVGGGDLCCCGLHQVGPVISGYWHDSDAGQLDVFVTSFSAESTIQELDRHEAKTLLDRAFEFIRRCRMKKHRGLEESGGAFEFGEMIVQCALPSLRGRLILLTNRLAPGVKLSPTHELEGCDFAPVVFDLDHFASLISPGQRDSIRIDFADNGLPDGLFMLKNQWSNPVYDTYIGMMPGESLAQIYNQYGARLLEQNVRSFLQARGKVNRGIRETLLRSPEMFLAYNNGLCATASAVEFGSQEGSVVLVRTIHDFQIVNGGQTTASIASALVKSKADLTCVVVPLKLSVLRDKAQVAQFVSSVARYANSQNKVSEADLAANDAFHVHVEQLSRTVWTPSQTSARTKWFYERARGQYADERGRCRTESERRPFDAEYPRRQ